MTQPNPSHLIVSVHRHGAWLFVGCETPLFVTQVGDVSEVIEARTPYHPDVGAEFDPNRALGNVGVLRNPIRVNGGSNIGKAGQQISPFRVDQKQGNRHGNQH